MDRNGGTRIGEEKDSYTKEGHKKGTEDRYRYRYEIKDKESGRWTETNGTNG